MKKKFTHFKIREKERPEARQAKPKEFTPMELQNFKQQIEQFRKALGEKMKDPSLAKKAAHLLSLWIAGENVDANSKIQSDDKAEKKKKKAA